MGTLLWKNPQTFVSLRSVCVFGRRLECDVCVDNTKISSEHASMHWIAGRWELRDLGSRNGTFLSGRRLAQGERALLEVGATFSLSRTAAVFELVDAGSPGAAARHLTSGLRRVAASGMLVLPDDDRPMASIFESGASQWLIEIDADVRAVRDQEVIVLDGEAWALELPRIEIKTCQSDVASPGLEFLQLRLRVSPDEKQMEATAVLNGRPTRLPPRRYHHLLLTLARAWLADSTAPRSLRGWVNRDELCRQLAMDANKLNVEIHRARKQLAAVGVMNAAGLVERRAGTGELRLGVWDVEVGPL